MEKLTYIKTGFTQGRKGFHAKAQRVSRKVAKVKGREFLAKAQRRKSEGKGQRKEEKSLL